MRQWSEGKDWIRIAAVWAGTGIALSAGSYNLWADQALPSEVPTSPLVATSVLTIQDAIDAAHANNPELKKMKLSANSSHWARLDAISEHLPQLKLGGSTYLGAKYATLGVLFGGQAVQFPSAFPQSEFSLEASLLLFDGLGAVNRYLAANLESDAAELELKYAKFKLDEMVKIKFHQALAAKEQDHVSDQNIETLEQHLTLARASEQAGISTSVDVLRIEFQLEEARAEKILTADNVAIARQELNSTIGVEKDDRLLEDTLPIPDPGKVRGDLIFNLSKRDDLQAQLQRERAQDRLNSAASSVWFPKVSLFGVEQFYKYGSFDPVILPNSTFQNAYAYGFKVTWNLFDGGASIARKVKAENSSQIASENSRRLLIQSESDFDIWKRKYIYNTALFQARKRAVEKSTESVRLATISVQAGTKTHSEVLDAELELFHARAGVIRAQVDALEALSNLELALGHPL